MQAHKIYIRQPKVTRIKLSSCVWFSIHNSVNSEATPWKSTKHKTYCQQRRSRPTLLWLENDPRKEWTSQTRENPGTLCYIIMLFVLPENLRQWPLAEPCSYKHFHAEPLAWPAQVQSSTAHLTLFPAAQHLSEKRTCAFTPHKPLSLSYQSHHQLRQGMLFRGRMPGVEAAMVCCDAWQVLHHLSFLQQPWRTRRQRKDCMCLPWSTCKKVLEAKLTQAGL